MLLSRGPARSRVGASGPLAVALRRLFSSAPEVSQAESSAGALKEFRAQVQEFAQQAIAPHAEAIDRENDFPTSVNLWKELGSFGLLGEAEPRELWSGSKLRGKRFGEAFVARAPCGPRNYHVKNGNLSGNQAPGWA